MSKILITIGLCFITVGLITHLCGDKLEWFGNLFWDINIVKSNYGFYFPITPYVTQNNYCYSHTNYIIIYYCWLAELSANHLKYK